jgi:hypothetical protein
MKTPRCTPAANIMVSGAFTDWEKLECTAISLLTAQLVRQI